MLAAWRWSGIPGATIFCPFRRCSNQVNRAGKRRRRFDSRAVSLGGRRPPCRLFPVPTDRAALDKLQPFQIPKAVRSAPG
jgi:hypothetical protein